MSDGDAPAMQGSVLVGLIGSGIQASRTPALHEQEGRAHGLPYLYRLIDLDVLALDAAALPDLILAAERLGFRGLNITYPCKQSVIPLLTDLDEHAAAVGAVNTVVFSKGRRRGCNTDWSGFAESFRRELADAPRARVVQLGAGGAGAAVAHALLTLGTGELLLTDPEPGRAEALADRLCSRFGAGRARAVAPPLSGVLGRADGVVNATPVGMARFPGAPLAPELLTPRLWVADVIYFPMETALLRAARAAGCRTMSGAGMAVFQAAEAFRLFSGRTADPARMLAHFAAM